MASMTTMNELPMPIGVRPTGGGTTGGGAPAMFIGTPSTTPKKEIVDLTSGKSAADAWALENDPIYQMAMRQGQSAFNVARGNALAGLQNQQIALNRQNERMSASAQDARRQLAGNFAARGMQRGGYGAYYRAQDAANAQQIAAQTDIKDQIAALNQNFLGQFGAIGTDWTATAIGQDYRNQAIQQALAAQIARYGTV